MKRSGLLGIFIVFLVVAAAGALSAQGPVTLEYSLTPGRTISYLVSLDGTGTIGTAEEGLLPMTLLGSIDFVQRAGEISEDGWAQMEMSIPRMETNTNIAGVTINKLWENGKVSVMVNGQPSPAQGANPPAAAPLFGVPLKVRMNRQGKMDDVASSGLDFLQKAKGNLDLSEMIRACRNELPDHPVQAGDSWSVEVKSPPAGAGEDSYLSEKTSYTLASLENVGGEQTAKIEIKDHAEGKGLKVTTPLVPRGSPGTAVMEELKQEGRGTIFFSLQSGQVTKGEFNTSTQAVISEGTLHITVNLKSKVTLALK